jgi:hypothetical protein
MTNIYLQRTQTLIASYVDIGETASELSVKLINDISVIPGGHEKELM